MAKMTLPAGENWRMNQYGQTEDTYSGNVR